MPQSTTVVKLSDEERSLLRDAANNKAIDSVIAELRRTLLNAPTPGDGDTPKHAKSPVRTLADTGLPDRDRYEAAKAALGHRANLLRELPSTSSGSELLQTVERAQAVIDEALAMLTA